MIYSQDTIERMDAAIRGPRVAVVNKSDLGNDWTAEAHVPAALPKFPDVTVQLTGEDANGFFIVARARKALMDYLRTEEGMTHQEAWVETKPFFDDALSANYDHLLAVVMEWVTVA